MLVGRLSQIRRKVGLLNVFRIIRTQCYSDFKKIPDEEKATAFKALLRGAWFEDRY